MLTIGVVTAAAELTLTARGVGKDDMVAGGKALHPGADALDHSCSLVTQNQRQRDGILLVTNVNIRLTDPGRDNANENLIRARRLQIQLPKDKRARFLFNDGCPNEHGEFSKA
jgi:hypothetical protein